VVERNRHAIEIKLAALWPSKVRPLARKPMQRFFAVGKNVNMVFQAVDRFKQRAVAWNIHRISHLLEIAVHEQEQASGLDSKKCRAPINCEGVGLITARAPVLISNCYFKIETTPNVRRYITDHIGKFFIPLGQIDEIKKPVKVIDLRPGNACFYVADTKFEPAVLLNALDIKDQHFPVTARVISVLDRECAFRKREPVRNCIAIQFR